MESISITSEVKNGRLTRNRSLLTDAVKSFEGKTIEIIVKRKRKTSSDPQRKYYWAVLIPIIKQAIKYQWGEIYSKEQTNEFLKMQFAFDEKVNEATGEILRIPKSPTNQMSAFQREIFHEQCRNLAKEYFGVIIPLPNEDLQINYEHES